MKEIKTIIDKKTNVTEIDVFISQSSQIIRTEPGLVPTQPAIRDKKIKIIENKKTLNINYFLQF